MSAKHQRQKSYSYGRHFRQRGGVALSDKLDVWSIECDRYNNIWNDRSHCANVTKARLDSWQAWPIDACIVARMMKARV